jgi:hypothetical protein
LKSWEQRIVIEADFWMARLAMTLCRPNSLQKLAACNAAVALGADNVVNTSPLPSLTITPILIFLFSLSMAASQLTLKNPFKGAYQLVFLEIIATSSKRRKSYIARSCDENNTSIISNFFHILHFFLKWNNKNWPS